MNDSFTSTSSPHPVPPPIRPSLLAGTRKQSTPAPLSPPPVAPAQPVRAARGGRPAHPSRRGAPRGGGKGGPRGRRGPHGRSNGVHFGPPKSRDLPNVKQPPRN